MSNQYQSLPEEPDYVAAPPRANDAMFYGLIGQLSLIATQGSEVSRVASASNFITLLSAAAGRYHYVEIGDVTHPLMQFMMHVGRSAVAGKGEAMGLPNRICDAVNLMMETLGVESEETGVAVPFLGQHHGGGLSTGEGIARLVHDGIATKDLQEPPIHDKRLLVTEPELARALQAAKRQNSTLSPTLRDLWDGGSIRPATKGAPIWATDPHISIRTAITPDELRKYMTGSNATNGLFNRFLIYFAERSRDIPFPKRTPSEEIERLAVKVRDVGKFMLGSYPREKHQVAITMSPEAAQMYADAYPQLRGRVGSSELVNSLLERRAPIACRLAALFALTDYQVVIGPEHMRAALAWADYHRASVEYLFGGDENARKKADKQAEMERKILNFLGEVGGWATRTDITRFALHNHSRGQELAHALDSLLLARQIEQETRPKANGAGDVKRYRLRHEPSVPTHHTANQETIGEVANEANEEQQTDSVSHSSHHSHSSSPDADDSNQSSASSGYRQEIEQRAEEETLHHQPKPTSPVDHQAVH